jgi:hypothetical protein
VPGTTTVVTPDVGSALPGVFTATVIYFGSSGQYGLRSPESTGFSLLTDGSEGLCWQLFKSGNLASVTFSLTLTSRIEYGVVQKPCFSNLKGVLLR